MNESWPVRSTLLAAACCALALSACSRTEKSAAVAQRAPASLSAPAQAKIASGSDARAPNQRHVAVRQYLAIEVDPGEVEAVLRDALARCSAPACEILESSLARDARDAPPRASLRLRIVPGATAAFVGELVRRGDIIEQRSESEDKTDQVIDVDARLKSMTELRDRLRALLANRAAAVKDLVEIESQLARVQGELESAIGRRKALADETEKVTLAVEIRSRRSAAESGALEPVRYALKAIGHTFAQSLAGLISFVVAVVPWMLLVVPAIWLWRRWRRARRNQP